MSEDNIKKPMTKVEPKYMKRSRVIARKVWDANPKARKSTTKVIQKAYKEYKKELDKHTAHILGVLRSGYGSGDKVFKNAMKDFNDTVKKLEHCYATANAWMELVEAEKKGN